MRFSTPCIYYNCLSSAGTHSVNRQSWAVFSGNLQKLFVSVQKLQRVWSLSERAGGWQQARKSCFLTQCGRPDLLKAALQIQNVFRTDPLITPMQMMFTHHSKCYLAFTHPPGMFVQSLPWSVRSLAPFSPVNPGVSCLVADESSSCEQPSTQHLLVLVREKEITGGVSHSSLHSPTRVELSPYLLMVCWRSVLCVHSKKIQCYTQPWLCRWQTNKVAWIEPPYSIPATITTGGVHAGAQDILTT